MEIIADRDVKFQSISMSSLYNSESDNDDDVGDRKPLILGFLQKDGWLLGFVFFLLYIVKLLFEAMGGLSRQCGETFGSMEVDTILVSNYGAESKWESA